MSKRKKNKNKNKNVNRIDLDPLRTVEAESEIQKRVVNTDMQILTEHQNLVSYIRIYIPGEFPPDFLDENERTTIKWTLVSKKNNTIVRGSMTQEQFLQIRPQNDFPTVDELPAGAVAILPIEWKEK